MERWRCPAWIPAVVLGLTVAQLAVGAFVPGIERFEDKAFPARLVANPLMMLAAPAIWWWHQRRTAGSDPAPWGAFTLIMASFFIDVTGNSLDLYDPVSWWDNFSHFLTWVPLCAGIGLLTCQSIRPRWAIVAVVTGLGAVLAVGWEIGEWYSFIRRGTELEGAYEDTLSDQLLGLLGGFTAALFVAWRSGKAPGRASDAASRVSRGLQ
jgi:hypothetical protein